MQVAGTGTALGDHKSEATKNFLPIPNKKQNIVYVREILPES
jgi:hypothetical protein